MSTEPVEPTPPPKRRRKVPPRKPFAAVNGVGYGNSATEFARCVGETRAQTTSANAKRPWAQADGEPSIADLLSDPTTLTLMRADGVIVRDVLAIIDTLIQSRVGVFGEFQ